MKLSILCSILLFPTLSFSRPFPAEEFFSSINVKLDAPSKIEQYLCEYYDRDNPKMCCSCQDDCLDDCCIDMYWNESASYDLKTYLNIFKRKVFEGNSKCQPIVSTIFAGEVSRHIVAERRVMQHGTSFISKGVFHNEQDGVDLLNLNISASCNVIKDIPAIGTIFLKTLESRSKMKCIFDIDGKDGMENCRHERRVCRSKQSPFYDMCQMYSAPINGYKNPHCLACEVRSLNKNYLNGCKDFKNLKSKKEIELKLEYSSDKLHLIIKKVLYNFPIIQFNNHTESNSIDQQSSRFIGCTSEESDFSCCDCDSYCFKTKTCCADVLWNQTSPSRSMEEYKQTLLERSKYGKTHACRKIISTSLNAITYYMISSCPDGIQANLCADEHEVGTDFSWVNVTPVLGSDGFVYKNAYCALCNLINIFKPMTIQLSCFKEELPKYCDINVDEEEVKKGLIKECKLPPTPFNDSCPKTHKYHNLCKSYNNPFGGFKNKHCLFCMKKDFALNSNDLCPASRRVHFYSYYMLITFTDSLRVSKVKQKASDSVFCPSENLYDMNEFINVRDNTKCLISKIIHDPNVDNCVSRFGINLFIFTRSQNNSLTFLTILGINHSELDVYFQNHSIVILRLNRIINASEMKTIARKYYEEGNSMLDTNTTLILSQYRSPIISDIHQLGLNNQFPNAMVCYEISYLNLEQLIFTPNCSAYYNGSLIQQQNLSMWISMREGNIDRHAVTCQRFYMKPNCALHQKTNISIFDNGSIADNTGDLYKIEEYIPTVIGMAICEIQTTTFISFIREIETKMTYVLVSLSIPSYLAVEVTYLKFEKFWNLAGRCTVALSFSLMMGDTMYLINGILAVTGYNDIFPLCKAVAIMMHFFLSQAYIWTLLISHDIMKHITKIIYLFNNHVVQQRFYRFLIITFLTSFAFTGTAYFLDEYDIVQIGYGENGICVPHEFHGRVVFYIVPIFLSMFISFGFLLRAFIVCKLEKKRIDKSLKGSRRENINITKMFMKLAFVLGITEVIGIVQVANIASKDMVFNSIIGMMYSVTRSMRGIILLLVYVCKKDVFDLCNGRVVQNKDFRLKTSNKESTMDCEMSSK